MNYRGFASNAVRAAALAFFGLTISAGALAQPTITVGPDANDITPSSLAPADLEAGDTIDLTFTISGSGGFFEDGPAWSDMTLSLDLDAALSGMRVSGVIPSTDCSGTGPSGGASTASWSGMATPVPTFTPLQATCEISVAVVVPVDAPTGPYTVSGTLAGAEQNYVVVSNVYQADGAPTAFTLPVSFTFTVTTDTTAPTPTIDAPTGIVSASAPFDVTVSFDEAVSGFLAGDVTIANGTLSGFSSVTDEAGFTRSGTFQVTPTGAGDVTIELAEDVVQDDAGNGNVAESATVTIGTISTFTGDVIDDPVSAGATATLRFVIENGSATDSLLAGAFTVDIDQSLAGLVATAVPAGGYCGASSAATIQSAGAFVSFSGIEVAASATCTMDVTLTTPGAAAGGTYAVNSGSLSYVQNSVARTADPATAALQISGGEGTGAPLVFSKTFTDDPVVAGSTVTLEYTIVPEEGADATNLAFTDDLDAALTGLVATGLPLSNVCGTGSTLSGTSTITLSGGNVVDGATCTFSVTLQTPGGAAAAAYPSTTSDLTGSQDDGGGPEAIASGFTASDSLTLFAAVPQVQVTGPAGPVGVGVGFTATIEFSEPVTGFEVGDLTVVNGVASAFSGDGEDFTVTITPAAIGTVEVSVGAGVAQDTDTNANAASNTFTVQAVAAAPEIEVQIVGASLAITDGSATASTGALTDFGNVDVTSGSVTRTVRISNTGTSPLTIASVVLTDLINYTAGTTPASVAAGGSQTFTVTYDPTSLATHAGTITINSDDADEAAFDFAITGTGVAGPEIEVRGNSVVIDSGDSSASAADHTEFADAAIAATSSRTFTINNLGSGALTLGANAVSITNDSAGVFSVSDQPATSIASSGTDTFTVDFTPDGAGVFNALVSIANDDSDESPHTFVIQGTGTGAPEVQLEGNSIEIIAGDASPDVADGTAFGSILAGTTATANFTIRNTGTTNLSLTAPSGARDVIVERVSGSADFTVTAQPGGSGVIAPGGSQVFTIQYAPTTDGADTAVFGFANTDAGESPYQFTVSGEGVTPEIAVAGLGDTDIGYTDGTPDAGDGTDFGATGFSAGAPITRTFTISNPGTGVLTLGADAVSLSGAGVGDWTVTTQPAATVAPNGGTTTFVISFDPTEQLVRTATVSIANDDADEAPFTFAVTGTGADDVAPSGYTVAFNPAFVNGGNAPAISFTFADAEVGADYVFTITSDGGAGSVSGSGTVATAGDQPSGIDVSGLPDGLLTLSVTLTDSAGNAGAAATDTVTKDTGAPSVASIERQTPSTEQTNADTLVFRVSFSEAVASIDTADFAASGTSAAVTSVTPNGTGVYDVTIAGGDLAGLSLDLDGTQVSLGFAPGQDIVDLAGNTLSSTNPTGADESYLVNNAAPVLASITRRTPASEVTNADTLEWGFGFSTISTNFSLDASDFTLTGTSATLSITRYSVGFYVTASGGDLANLDGPVSITLDSGIVDEFGNTMSTATPSGANENSYTLDNGTPGVTIGSASSDPVSGAFTATFTFTEDVTGFAVGDLIVGNGAASNFAGSGDSYTATITPAADGPVTVDIAAGVATDSAGNANTAATQFSITNDGTAPGVSIATTSSDPVSGVFSITVTFDEAVTGFALGDLSVGNGAASNFSATSATVYIADITPAADGTVTVDVAAGVATDAAGNANTAATQFSIENDGTAPGVSIATASSEPVSGLFSITVTFDEAVTGFALGDLSVGNGAASNFSATSATVYTADITPAADGTVTVDIAAGVATDAAGNANTAATQFSITNDGTAPGVSIATTSSDPVSGVFSITVTFDEAVTGFALGDLSVGNGAASNFSATSASVYTADITPAADGTVTVDVAAGVATDAAGNANTAATQFSITNDGTAPGVSITTASADPVSGVFSITVTFDEAVTGFAVGDLSVGNGAASNFSATSATVYIADITPAADGTVTVDVAAGVATDAAGNANTAATQFSIENDGTAPGVSIATASSEPVSGLFSITVTFDEAVTGFAFGDLSVGNGAASNFSATSATVYTADITPAADGTVTVDIAAGVATDAAGNANTAATQFSITNDGTAPGVSIATTSSDPVSGVFSITVTFDEAVTGFAPGDLIVGNGAASNFSATSASVYTADITPAADGTVTVDIAAGVATDSAGNANTAATQFSITNDGTAPGVSITTASADPVSGVFSITVTFDEAVTGFAVGDLSVGNGAASNFSATSATVYIADITPAADGTVTVDVAAGVATDAAGNANTAATQFSIENDGTAPGVSIATASSEPVSGLFSITVTFDEAVTGFALGDLSVGNGAASNFSATSATVYTADITPAADGTVTVDIAAGVATDAAGNANTAATQFSITNDGTAPGVSIATTSSDPVSGVFSITVTFDEAVTGFALGDLSVGNGAASNFSATSATVYTADITPAADGAVTVDVAAGVANDSAGNANTAATQLSVTNDGTAPGVSITTANSDPVSGAFSITVTFDEAVTGFALGDLTVGNGAASNFSATSASVYTADITPATDGAVTVDIAAGVATDAAGNANTAATQFSIENDGTAPGVSITTANSDPVSGAFSITVTFDEAVTGFALGDLTVGNGAASNFSTTSATIYSADITPAADGAVTVDIAAGVAQDAAGNANRAATQFSITNDGTAPGVSITTASADPVSGVFSITVTFDEAVTGFALGDLTVGNGAASDFSATSASVYTADITPAADGTVTVDVAAGVASDAAGNANIAAEQFSIEADATAPGVTISFGPPVPVDGPPSLVAGPFNVQISFDESVTDLTPDDIVVGNGIVSDFGTITLYNTSTGFSIIYVPTITPTGDGEVTVDVRANVVQDAAGNGNTAAQQFSISADLTAPGVTIATASSDPVSGVFSITVTFDEAVTGFALGDLSVGNGVASNFSATSATVYTADITPAADGTVTVDIAAGVASDAAGNANTAATQFSITNDATAPSVAIASASSDPISGVFSITVTFDEAVTGFAVGDLSVGNGAASNFSATSASVYTADITPAADGTVTVDIPAGVATDAAGNANTAATQFSIESDVTAPTVASVTVSDADLRLDNVDDVFTLTITFTEAVDPGAPGSVSFDPDVSATLSTTDGVLSADGLSWVLTATVLDGGQSLEGVQVSVSGFADIAGNAIVAYQEADVFAVEMARAGLTVSVEINGDTDGVFDFTGDLDAFQVSTTGQTGDAVFASLAEGDYTFTLADADGFSLDQISCSGAEAVTNTDAGSVSLTLDPGAAAQCRFDVTADPGIDPQLVVEIPLILPPGFTDPASVSATFPLTNVGGAALDYLIEVDVEWLSVTPNSGSIPTGGTVEFTVAFTDAVLDLEPGFYTATISFFNLSGATPAGAGSAIGTQSRHSPAVEPFQIPVTVEIVERNGTLTLVATAAQSDLAGEASFLYQSDIASVTGRAIDTASGTGAIGPLSVERGAYTITQTTPEGWRLDSISCVGDADGGSTFELGSGVLNLDLDPNESVVCTFANVPDEAYVRGVTTAAIREFMAQRADQILSNSPRISERLRRGRDASRSGFAADFTEGRFTTEFATSLSAMRNAGRDGDPFAREDEPAYAGFDLSNAAGPGVIDVWVQASYAGANDNRAGQNSSSRFGMAYLGVDMMLSRDVLAGILVQFDRTETSTGALASQVEGDGWLAGPYVAMRLNDGLYVDARAAWGRSDNSVNPLGTYWDDFETDRWLIEANIVGDIQRGAWRFSPAAGLAWFDEDSIAYIDSLGFDIPSQSVTIGRARFEPELAYRFEHGPQSFMEPYLKLTANYDFEEAEVFNTAGGLQGLGAFRIDGRIGFNAGFANGAILGAEVSLSGIGESDFDASSAMIRLRTPLALP